MKPKTILIAALALVGFLVGFVFFRGPTPHITIQPEPLWHTGLIDSGSFLVFNVTNTMITSWLVVATLIVTVFFATRRWDIVPRGVQNVIEAVVEAFYNLVVSVAGEKNGRRFFPVVATIFFFVLASNWLSLLPIFNVIGKFEDQQNGAPMDSGFVVQQTSVGSLDIRYVPFSGPGGLKGQSINEEDADAKAQAEKARDEGKSVGELLPFLRGPNTDLNTPLALAIVSAIAVETWAISSLGLFSYGTKFINFGTFFRGLFRFNLGMVFQGIIEAFVGILELISELVRLVSFTFRLFGNMFAGEVVIVMFTFLTPLIVTMAFYGLELFVGVIQAFIFAMLTLVFGMMAVAHGDHGEEKHNGKEHAEGIAEPALEAAAQ